VARNPELKGFLTFPGFANDEDWYAFVFVVHDFSGELIDPPEGYLKWIPDSELARLNLWEGDLIFLPWLEQPGYFSGKFTYKEGCLVDHQVVFHHP
jgi:8-oxo-dGTP diphosphatase